MTLTIALNSSPPPATPAGLLELVECARAGGADAMEPLLRAIEQRVFLFCYRIVANAATAEDAAQETLWRVCLHLGRFQANTNFWAWVYRIALRQCQTELRKRRFEPLPPEIRAPGSAAASHERFDLVVKALAGLTEKERAALVLMDIEGYNSREAARIMGCLSITARTRAAAGRKKAREALLPHFPELGGQR